MKIRNIVLVLCLLASTGMVRAQSPQGVKWSLRQCIDYAIEHNIEIKQQQLNVESSEIDLNTAKNSRLPNLTGSAGENFGFGWAESSTPGVYQSSNSASTSLSMSSSTSLFAGNRINRQIDVNAWDLKAALESLSKAKENLELQVAAYYLDVLLRKELLNVAWEQAALTEKQVSQTQALVEAGKVPESQLYDIRAKLAQNQVAITTAQNNLDNALLNLTQLLNLPDTEGFDVREPETEHMLNRNQAPLLSPDHIYDIALGIKPHIREAEYLLESSKSSVKVAESSRYPYVNLNLGISSRYYYAFNSDYEFDPFFTQLENNRQQSIGLSIGIPIFNRLQTRNQIRTAKLRVQDRNLNLDNTRLALYKEIQQAHQSALAAESTYSSADVAYESARLAYQYTEERYAIGKSTVYELSESQNNLITSISEQVRAKYEYVFRAKILDFYRGEPIDIR